jgi:integrase
MPRRSKGPRLYLRSGRPDRNGAEIYVIRDGSTEISTGCGPDRLQGPEGAEAQLAAYITSKYRAPIPDAADGPSNPTSVLVADVIAYYARERAPNVADPVSTGIRLSNIAAWWEGKSLADVRRSTCKAYVEHRCRQSLAQAKTEAAKQRKVTPQGARRELEDFSAAIGFWHEEWPLAGRPKVWMPEKKESPRDALSRHQAARLLMAARGRRWIAETPTRPGHWIQIPGRAQASRAHLRRFCLIGFYTGPRPGVIPKLLKFESPVQAWVDIATGTLYRRGKSETDHKTKRRPLVKMPGRLHAHMRRWYAMDEREALRRAAAAKKVGAEPAPAPATILHHGWKPITGRIRKGFATLVADAGLDPEITPHWMRHTCATWIMENLQDEDSLWEASSYTGMTVTTLEKVYGHHRPNHQDKARKSFTGRK